ncbi:hypothetical protein OPV22_017100 [Ensete ventricosum]|uniref:Uncharacterized protein n=1 Tax=Ensete ventricosum TaxID=4639 RepID=A0AAV8PEX4_ENSVE|nr:hypothetical protein OPV22_017100 [Ensete ventricosum]
MKEHPLCRLAQLENVFDSDAERLWRGSTFSEEGNKQQQERVEEQVHTSLQSGYRIAVMLDTRDRWPANPGWWSSSLYVKEVFHLLSFMG